MIKLVAVPLPTAPIFEPSFSLLFLHIGIEQSISTVCTLTYSPPPTMGSSHSRPDRRPVQKSQISRPVARQATRTDFYRQKQKPLPPPRTVYHYQHKPLPPTPLQRRAPPTNKTLPAPPRLPPRPAPRPAPRPPPRAAPKVPPRAASKRPKTPVQPIPDGHFIWPQGDITGRWYF